MESHFVINYRFSNVQVHIENDLINKISTYLNKDCKYFIITDDNVASLYLDAITKHFKHQISYVIASGETSKNFLVCQQIIAKMLLENITKHDYVIAFGGGVVTDLVGFIASIYKRGINFISIPTTLLAQVDSSIGGKNGLDFQANNFEYKNQIGTIYHPEMVLIDPLVLRTLTKTDYLSGLGEVIKYGLCFDNDLFNDLFTDFSLLELIKKCIHIKANITTSDEFENNIRFSLNFGHTIAHAIESISNYSVPHGIAVCIGMLYEINDELIKDKLLKLYSKLGIDINYDFNIHDLIEYIKQDKKISGQEINVVIVEKIGSTIIKKMQLEEYLRGLS